MATNRDGERRCNCCGRYKPLTPDYFHRHRGHPAGLDYWCKLCKRRAKRQPGATDPNGARYSAAYRKAHPERVRALRKRYLQSARGKLIACRQTARRKLKLATTTERRKRLRTLIKAYDAEIRRMDRKRLAVLPRPESRS